MDLDPRIESVSSQEALEARGQELEKEGRRVLPCNLAEEGIFGKLAFFIPPEGQALVEEWTDEKADAVWVTWLKYGQKLVPDVTEVTNGNLLHQIFTLHSRHEGFSPFSNPTKRCAGFICHCQAGERKASLVFQVNLTVAKELPPELMELMSPNIQVVKS